MRAYVRAALAALAFGAFAVPSAQADWRDSIYGPGIAPAAQPTSYVPAAAPKPTAKPKQASKSKSKSNSLVQQASLPSTSTWTGSIGGTQSGIASYYWQPQRVASGGWFNPNAMTAAHRTLPFGTKVQVTNLNNGQSVVVTINDRGPFIKGRIIDLSSAAAGAIGMKSAGLARVNVAVLGR
jgi:rare lipoprotein A (peptidoglycan hydrolase)